MNERIRELIEQATKHYPATESSGEFSTFDKEKFAELIVRECDKYVTERWDVCEPWMDPGDLLKHFGVEE